MNLGHGADRPPRRATKSLPAARALPQPILDAPPLRDGDIRTHHAEPAAMPTGVARHGAPQTYRQSCRTRRLP